MISKKLSKKKVWGFIILALIVIVAWAMHGKKKANSAMMMPPVSVKLGQVVQQEASNQFSAIGTVKAAQGIDVSTQVAGTLATINFTSGQTVQKGQILFTLKNEDLQAVVSEDRAKLLYDQDQYARYKKLSSKGWVTASDTEQNKSLMNQAKAQLDHDQALLDQTIIRAPFSGVLGVSQVSLGQYVTAGQSIVSLQDRSMLYVDFYVPERMSDLVQVGRHVIAYSQQTKNYSWDGEVIAAGSAMDNDTRSLMVRAKIVPPYTNLMPGMYVNVSLAVSDDLPQLIIPQEAVVYNPYGDAVYVYQKGKVFQKAVELGDRIGNKIMVRHGLSKGETIVIAGQQKLYNGASVVEGK